MGDALFAVQPIIRAVLDGQMDYLFTAKEESHRYLYEEIVSLEKLGEVHSLQRSKWNGKVHTNWRYRWANGARLKNEDDSLDVNWVELIQSGEDGKQRYRIAFLTSHLITEANVEEVVAAGRARWKIENEDISALKTTGCRIEHDFGQGKHHPAQTLLSPNILAFRYRTVMELLDSSCVLLRHSADLVHAQGLEAEGPRGGYVGQFPLEVDPVSVEVAGARFARALACRRVPARPARQGRSGPWCAVFRHPPR